MVTAQRVDQVEDLWASFGEGRDIDIRNKLLLYYSPLVKYVAGRLAAGLPQNVQHDDLVSYGWFGLIDAVQRFDPSREIKFETYAMQRIRGAILDELRKSDWVPRSVRQKARSIEKAMTKLEGREGRSATEPELADELGVTLGHLHKMLTDISNAGIIALDEVLGPHSRPGDSLALVDTLADSTDGPMGSYEKQEVKAILASAINNMGDREKWVLMLYYFERFTLADIGRVLSVTESRVCQIHTKAVLHLRSQLSRRLNGPE